MACIDEAVIARAKAIELTPPRHPYLPIRLVNLTRSLHERFQYTAGLQDADRAILSMRRAVEATSPGDPSLVFRLSMLGNSFYHRFQSKGTLSDLNQSISVYRQALSLPPSDDTQMRAVVLNDLANSLYRRFQATGRREDIKDAISFYRRAIAIHTQLNIEAHGFLNGLVAALHARFEGPISALSSSSLSAPPKLRSSSEERAGFRPRSDSLLLTGIDRLAVAALLVAADGPWQRRFWISRHMVIAAVE